MKKITKLGVLSLALVALTTALFAKADKTVQQDVSLTLTAGEDTCTIADYAFGSHTVASSTDIPLGEVEHDITCDFLANSGSTITLSLSNLTGVQGEIAYTNFQMEVDQADAEGLIGDLTGVAYTTFGAQAINVYVKPADLLGSWESTLTLSGTVPAGKPAGEYHANLDLTIQY